MERKTEWKMRVYFLDACNCDWGCPCQFNAKPTHGNCDGFGAYRVLEGYCGDIDLAGLDFVWIGVWPGPVHKGHGKIVYYIDDRASTKQVEALSQIVSGKAGGGPFSIYASMADEIHGPKFARISFRPNGIESQVKVEGVAEVVLEPIRNPVTGEIHRAIIELPSGFEASRMDQASTRRLKVNDEVIKFEYSGTYASFQETSWQGP
jgi:hypothetical protein